MKKFVDSHPILFAVIAAAIGFFIPGIGVFGSVIAFGAVMNNGILGGLSGKIGGAVAGKWKTTNYLRAHVKPKNPQTTAQQLQRNRMSMIVSFARQIKSTIIDTFWSPFYSSISGFNAFVSYNSSSVDFPSLFLTADSVISRGSLQSTAFVACSYVDSLSVEWENNAGVGNALATDHAVILAVHKDGTLYTISTTRTRGDGTLSTTEIPEGLVAADLRVYLFFHRGTGSSLLVSDSIGIIPAAV